jgi:hypothetical protein
MSYMRHADENNEAAFAELRAEVERLRRDRDMAIHRADHGWAEVDRLREEVKAWNVAYWVWVNTDDAGDMARLSPGDPRR